jgi:NADP-dependent 3-hydroxy acid dehydrogenase YdfG
MKQEAGMGRLDGKRVWITGASSGIGAATAQALSAEGAEAILSARRAANLEKLAAAIRADGGKAQIVPLDVADRAATEKAGKEIMSQGGVDVLVNNAGLMPLAPMIEGRVDEWEQMIDVNLKGLLYATNAVLRGMVERGSGHIVNIGSVAGRVTFPGAAVYCGTKFAVRAISDALRKEMTGKGVRVTDIQPGAVATELAASTKHEGAQEALTGEGGLYAKDADILQSEDIAAAILYVVTQPSHVNVNEVLIRPQIQEL